MSGELHETLFASKELSVELPKLAFPEGQTLPRFAFQAIYDELLLDGNARQNLATFCQTWEEPEVHQLMDLAIDKNLMDKDGMPRPTRTPLVRPRLARRKPACWVAWRPSGDGGRV